MNQDIKSIRSLLKENNLAEAGNEIEKLRPNLGSLPIFQGFEAIYLSKTDILDQAIALMAEVLERMPHDWSVYYNLAYWLRLKGHFRAAEQGILKSIRISPMNPVAYFLYAQVLSNQERHAEATMALFKSIELDNLFYPAYVSLSTYLALDNRPDLAVQLYQTALDTDPENAFFKQGLSQAKGL